MSVPKANMPYLHSSISCASLVKLCCELSCALWFVHFCPFLHPSLFWPFYVNFTFVINIIILDLDNDVGYLLFVQLLIRQIHINACGHGTTCLDCFAMEIFRSLAHPIGTYNDFQQIYTPNLQCKFRIYHFRFQSLCTSKINALDCKKLIL